MTQIGKECHSHCAIYHRVGECIMPREGVFAEVVKEGMIRPGDVMRVEAPDENRPFTAAVIVLSDKGSRGEREDLSGPAIKEILEREGYEVISMDILPDDQVMLAGKLQEIADSEKAELILTTGGTGFSERDVTPEATEEVIERKVPGIPEAIRAYSMTITKRAMLSRATAGIRGKTLIVNLPGSPKAVRESLEYIIDALAHGLEILSGEARDCARK